MRYCFYAKPDAAQWVAKLMDGRAKGPTSKVRTAAAAR